MTVIRSLATRVTQRPPSGAVACLEQGPETPCGSNFVNDLFGARSARTRWLISFAAAAVAGSAMIPLTGVASAQNSRSDIRTRLAAHNHGFNGHHVLGKLPAGAHLAGHIDTALLGRKGTVTAMLQLAPRAGAVAFAHPASGARSRIARVSAYRSQLRTIRAAQSAVQAHFSDSATRAQTVYTLHAGYDGIAVRTDASRLAALSRLPGVVAVHHIAALHAVNNVTVPLINAPTVWEEDAGATPGVGTGNGVTIGIIDTGLDYTHADFNGPGTKAAYD